MLAKFTCPNLAGKFPAVNLLNFWVAVFLSWSWSIAILFSVSLTFVLWSDFATKLQTLCILFSTAVIAVLIAKLVILYMLLLISFILASKAAVVAKLVIIGIFSYFTFQIP